VSPQHGDHVTPKSAPLIDIYLSQDTSVENVQRVYIYRFTRHVSIVKRKTPGCCYRSGSPLNEKVMKGRIITMIIALSMLGVILGLQFIHI
jgi:hypothetical protein